MVRSTLLFNDDLNGAFSYWLFALRTWSCPAADSEFVPALCKSVIALCQRHACVLLAQVLAALLILGCRVTTSAPWDRESDVVLFHIALKHRAGLWRLMINRAVKGE